jgi:hypothetical protein
MLVAVGLMVAPFRPAIADGQTPAPDSTGTAAEREPNGDLNPYRHWWLPGDVSWGGRMRAPSQSPARTSIEEAERLLETPRFDAGTARSLGVESLPSGDQVSRAWSDGAPLLLHDWSGKSGDPWAAPNLRQDGLQRVAGVNGATDFGDLSAKVKLRERDAQLDPSVRNAWETDQTVKVPVAGSVFVFNQVSGSTPDVDQHQYKVLGKTGVGLKVKPWLLQEVQFRTGPAVRYDDTTTLSKGQSPERSELFVEAVTKVPVPVVGPVNVEYSSYAVPAATPSDHNQINQDVKFALPFSGGQFHVGAKYKWESATATPWMDRMQVYLGVQNKW